MKDNSLLKMLSWWDYFSTMDGLRTVLPASFTVILQLLKVKLR